MCGRVRLIECGTLRSAKWGKSQGRWCKMHVKGTPRRTKAKKMIWFKNILTMGGNGRRGKAEYREAEYRKASRVVGRKVKKKKEVSVGRCKKEKRKEASGGRGKVWSYLLQFPTCYLKMFASGHRGEPGMTRHAMHPRMSGIFLDPRPLISLHSWLKRKVKKTYL